MATDNVEQALDLARSYVDPESILGDLRGLDINPLEQQEAALAIHQKRAQEVVNLVVGEFGERRLELETRRLGLLGEIALIDAEMAALKLQPHDNMPQRPVSVELQAHGSIGFNEYRQALQYSRFSETVILNSWKFFLETAYDIHRDATDNPAQLSAPENIEYTGNYAQFQKQLKEANIDTESFVKAVQYIKSFGSDFQDELEGIRTLFGTKNPSSAYRNFKIWEAFASKYETVEIIQETKSDSVQELYEQTGQRIKRRFTDWNKLDKNVIVEEAAQMAPFVLEFEVKDTGTGDVHFNLIEWTESRREKLRLLCGDWAKNSFVRGAYALARVINTPSDLISLEKDGSVVGQIINQNGSPVHFILTVLKPEQFMNRLLGTTNIGTKSATAIFCIADVQALERAEAQLEKSS